MKVTVTTNEQRTGHGERHSDDPYRAAALSGL